MLNKLKQKKLEKEFDKRIQKSAKSRVVSNKKIQTIGILTTNVETTSLKETDFIPLKKSFLFDFSDVKDELIEGIIDNIEGITFGPKLSNGNQSLLLVSDDNFQLYGNELNQFILMEIINK